MNGIVVIVSSAALWLSMSVHGDTCSSCTSLYTTDRDNAANDDIKCTALESYLACLDSATGAGCPISGTQAATIGADFDAISLTCFLSDACLCQKDYWSNIPNNCDAAKTLISCLRGTTAIGRTSSTACNGFTTVPVLAASAETVISNLGSCSIPDKSGCKCEVDYAKADVSSNENLCKHTKVFISCVKSLDETMCDGKMKVSTAAQAANSVIAAIGSLCTIPSLSACTCEINYAKSDISDNDKKCSAVKNYIGCLKGKTGNDCADGTIVVDLAIAADSTAASLPSCSLDDTPCGCELSYAKANIDTNILKCTELKKYISCLKGKTGSACDGIKSVSDLVTEAESAASNIPSCDLAGTTCGCEVVFAKKDTSSDGELCIETKKLISCLKTKTGIACDNKTTVVALATAAESTISGLSSCDVIDTPCACEKTYAKSGIDTDTLLCTATKVYGGCLKALTGTGCDGVTTVTSLVTAAEVTISSIPNQGCNNTGVCACEFSYAKADKATEDKKCAETKKFISCLKSKTGIGCDTVKNVSQLATEAETTSLNISREICSLEGTPCECETAYAKADISNDTLLCAETKKYGGCLKIRTGPGCDGSTSVASLVTTAEDTLSKIVGNQCDYTNNSCGCELSYAKSDISDNFMKCIQTKAYVSCLKKIEEIGVGCNGYTTKILLAFEAENTIRAIPDGLCPLDNTVCSCDLDYARSIIFDNITYCMTLRNYMSCLLGKTGSGCDGMSTLRTLANYTDAKIAALGPNECPKTDVCECEIAFAKADISSSMKLCEATKSLTTCTQNSFEKGCGAFVTRAHVGNFTQKVFTSIGTTICPLTDTCQCQIDFNKADVRKPKTCSAVSKFYLCLELLNKTSETGCDDIILNDELRTNSSQTTSVVCAAGTRVETYFLSSFLLLIHMVLIIYHSREEE